MSFLNPTTAEDPFATNQEKAEPHSINPDDLTPKNWKSSDGMYPDRRGGFNKADRTLWRKDRYNAVYGRYRDKNREYRNKNGHKLGDDNVTLLSFNNDKPFPGWANKPGSQFHPDDHPKVNADFYRNRENWPAKGLRSLALHPFEDDWNENGVPLKNEFHDLTTLPVFNGLNPKQLPDRLDLDKVFELQQQAIQNQAYAAQQQPQQPQQPNQTANTLQQIGSIVQAAAPLVAQGVSALAGAFSSGGGVAGADSGGASTKAGVGAEAEKFFSGEGSSRGGSTVESGFGSASANHPHFPVVPQRTMEHRFDDPVLEVVPLSAAGDSGMPERSAGAEQPVASSGEVGGFSAFDGSFPQPDPRVPTPEGLYGPMYPEPGFMTDQPPVVIRSGEPELVFIDSDSSGIGGREAGTTGLLNPAPSGEVGGNDWVGKGIDFGKSMLPNVAAVQHLVDRIEQGVPSDIGEKAAQGWKDTFVGTGKALVEIAQKSPEAAEKIAGDFIDAIGQVGNKVPGALENVGEALPGAGLKVADGLAGLSENITEQLPKMTENMEGLGGKLKDAGPASVEAVKKAFDGLVGNEKLGKSLQTVVEESWRNIIWPMRGRIKNIHTVQQYEHSPIGAAGVGHGGIPVKRGPVEMPYNATRSGSTQRKR